MFAPPAYGRLSSPRFRTGNLPISFAALSGNPLSPFMVKFCPGRVALRGLIRIHIHGITISIRRMILPAHGRPAIASHRQIFPLLLAR
jgi:hypothetical protein